MAGECLHNIFLQRISTLSATRLFTPTHLWPFKFDAHFLREGGRAVVRKLDSRPASYSVQLISYTLLTSRRSPSSDPGHLPAVRRA